jgi:hypothetical protein
LTPSVGTHEQQLRFGVVMLGTILLIILILILIGALPTWPYSGSWDITRAAVLACWWSSSSSFY